MSSSSVHYIKAVDAALTTKAKLPRANNVVPIRPLAAAPTGTIELPRAGKAARRRWFSRRSRQPTQFQLCLALHMFVAERRGALD